MQNCIVSPIKNIAQPPIIMINCFTERLLVSINVCNNKTYHHNTLDPMNLLDLPAHLPQASVMVVGRVLSNGLVLDGII